MSRFGGAVDAEVRQGRNRLADVAVFLFAVLVAILSARAYPYSSNDDSRLAAVESLVDHHRLAIDSSRFTSDTIDKLKVGEHFYSDKPYTLSLYLAGWYGLLKQTIGLDVRTRVDRFCWWLTLLSS